MAFGRTDREGRRGGRKKVVGTGTVGSRMVADGGEEEVCSGGSSLIPGWRLRVGN